MRSVETNLKKIAGLNGFTVTELANSAGKSRMTVYRAWSNPKQYGPTYTTLCRLLPVRGGRGGR